MKAVSVFPESPIAYTSRTCRNPRWIKFRTDAAYWSKFYELV